MTRKSGVSRIARELEEVRKEFALKNDVKLVDADREIAKAVRNLKGKVTKEIKF